MDWITTTLGVLHFFWSDMYLLLIPATFELVVCILVLDVRFNNYILMRNIVWSSTPSIICPPFVLPPMGLFYHQYKKYPNSSIGVSFPPNPKQ
jgi:hypothetical protein